jgi:phage terminase large subunit-like protein
MKQSSIFYAKSKDTRDKITEFKGIFTADGDGRYVVIGNRPAPAQGLHPSMVIFDELHVSNKDLWTALSLGSATRKDGIVTGITTAGDDGSELLLNLYRNGEYTIDSPAEMERFGFHLAYGNPCLKALLTNPSLSSN